MSISVALDNLVAEASRMGPWAYVLTSSGDGRPHALAAPLSWQDGELLAAVGRSSLRNVSERPLVSVVWPPLPGVAGAHSLIVDGTARVVSREGRDGTLAVTPTRAVYHRPAPVTPATCAHGAPPGPTAGCGPLHEGPY
jgi:hypothetical protein